MQSRKYKSLKGQPLESFFEIEIQHNPEKGNKKVFIHARLYVEPVTECPFSWSDEFSDHEILHDADFIRFIRQRWGNILAPQKPDM